MKDFNDRLSTFHSVRDEFVVSVEALAKAGFYYVGPHDKVQCYVCGAKLLRWEVGDDAIAEHKRISPDCGYIAAYYQEKKIISVTDVQMDQKHNRVKSFKDKQKLFPLPVSQLVDVGFYYVGPGDVVKCAYCHKRVKNWEAGDDALTEHKRISPDCEFIQDVPKLLDDTYGDTVCYK